MRRSLIHRAAVCPIQRLQGAAGLWLEAIEKRRRAERAADRFGGADRGEFLRRRSGGEEVGEVAVNAIEEWRDRGDAQSGPSRLVAITEM